MKFKTTNSVLINHKLYKEGSILVIHKDKNISIGGMVPMDAAAKEGFERVVSERLKKAKQEKNKGAENYFKDYQPPVDPDTREKIRIPGMKFQVKSYDQNPNEVHDTAPVDVEPSIEESVSVVQPEQTELDGGQEVI